ncbi:MAG: hypothetical protein M3Y85_03560 [Bacteroidota bacterium]|nr:hypothetical protein [Bacteroidota bacterium]
MKNGGSKVNLRIIDEKPLVISDKLKAALKECNELIGIFTASIHTAKANIF